MTKQISPIIMKTTAKTLTYDPLCGTSINFACKEAVAMAVNNKCHVKFNFNGINLEATPNCTPTRLISQFHTELDENARKYEESPEGIAHAKYQEEKKVENQIKIDKLIGKLSGVVSNRDKLMKWMGEFTECADQIGTKFDEQPLVAQLESVGYSDGQFTGNPPEWFNTKERMAGYLIGQAINCLNQGMPPHPMVGRFVEDYFKLES